MDEYYRNLKPKAVIISGGGAYGYPMYQCIDILQQKYNLFESTTHWSGISIGSVCALCGILKISPKYIVSVINKLLSTFRITPKQLIKAPDTYGIISLDPIIEALAKSLELCGLSPRITFKQLHSFTGKYLCIYAVDIETNTLKTFHANVTPDITIVDAIIASCSIPILFPYYYIQCGDTTSRYIDGGMLSDWAFPLEDFPDIQPKDMILINNRFIQKEITHKPPDNFLSYIQYIISIIGYNVERLQPQYRELVPNIPNQLTFTFEKPMYDLTIINDNHKEQIFNILTQNANIQ